MLCGRAGRRLADNLSNKARIEEKGGLFVALILHRKLLCLLVIVVSDTHTVSRRQKGKSHTLMPTQTSEHIHAHKGRDSKQQEVCQLVMFIHSRGHVMLFFLLTADPRKSTWLDIAVTCLTSLIVCVCVCVHAGRWCV